VPLSAALCTAAALLLTGCGSGPGSLNNDVFTPAFQGLSGRLVYQITMPMKTAWFNHLSQEDRDGLAAQGIVFRNETLVFPAVPANGQLVEIAGRRYHTNRLGYFTVPESAAGTATAKVFRQLSDTTEFGTAQLAGNLTPAGQTPRDVPLPIVLKIPRSMNTDNRAAKPGTKGRSDASCGLRDITNCANNNGPCCLDFDNPAGDGCAYSREPDDDEEDTPANDLGRCSAKAIRNWWNSTCFKWSIPVFSGGFGMACSNERAYRLVTGPNCYANHKFRNCQFLSATDFSATAGSTTIRPGRSTIITVRNFTPANETGMQMGAGSVGTVTGDGLTGSILAHYDNTRHYEVRTLTYTAPADLPAGQTDSVDTITFTAYDLTQTVRIKVCKCDVPH
jgi:hypothetical protein